MSSNFVTTVFVMNQQLLRGHAWWLSTGFPTIFFNVCMLEMDSCKGICEDGCYKVLQ